MIKIFCGNAEQPIIGVINRTANNNKAPRIMGGQGLQDWFQREMSEMQEVMIAVLSQTAIRIEPAESKIDPEVAAEIKNDVDTVKARIPKSKFGKGEQP